MTQRCTNGKNYTRDIRYVIYEKNDKIFWHDSTQQKDHFFEAES